MAIAMLLMKVVPAIPGHFTLYEWLALGVWIALGAICSSCRRRLRVILGGAALQRCDKDCPSIAGFSR